MRMNLPVTGRDVSISDTANILSTTDLNGDITYVNPDFIKISGFDEDELLGQQQVVVKNLEANYRKVPDVSGATIMGDGRVALILDVGSLVRRSRH